MPLFRTVCWALLFILRLRFLSGSSITTIFICRSFIKETPNGFPCLDTVIQTLGMLLDFRRAKNTRPAARVFLHFSACLDHSIQIRESIWYFLSRIPLYQKLRIPAMLSSLRMVEF